MLPATNTAAAVARPLTRNVPLVAAARDALLVYRKRISPYFHALALPRYDARTDLKSQ